METFYRTTGQRRSGPIPWLLLCLAIAAPVLARQPAAHSSPDSPGGSGPSDPGSPTSAADEDALLRPVPPFAAAMMVNEPDHGVWVRALEAAGLDAVQVTVYARQGRWDSADLTFSREAPAVVAEIRAAEAAGLKTILVLRTYLEHALPENRHLWHGMIWPAEGLVDEWFEYYSRFVRWGARLAERHGVDLLAVGNELVSLTSTAPADGVPDPWDYYLDARRTARVRRRLVDCAEEVPRSRLAPDLTYTDGTRFPDLDALLRDRERARRRWAARILGVDLDALQKAVDGGRDPSGLVDLGHLDARMRRYDRGWRRIVEEARRLYSGPVTYGANFDQVARVGFWDALDSISVNAYYPVSLYGLKGSKLRRHMAESWREIARDLRRIGRRAAPGTGLPVTFLEIGWTRKEGATVRPYSYHRVEVLETVRTLPGIPGSPGLTCVHWASQPDAPEERVAALEALLEVVRAGEFPELRGFSLWKLSTLPRHRSVEPFVVLLSEPPGGDARTVDGDGAPASSAAGGPDRHDRKFLRIAARLGRAIRPPP